MTQPLDPSDPSVWFQRLLEAIEGLQRGDKAPASTYLRFVAEHRWRDVAESARVSLVAYARGRAFANAKKMLDERGEKDRQKNPHPQ